MRRPSSEVHHSAELEEMLSSLDFGDSKRKWISDMDDVLKENMFAGDSVQKGLIPRLYIEKYGVNNLYRYHHPDGYRSCYTLVNFSCVGICPLILDLRTHTDYEKVFGYKMGD